MILQLSYFCHSRFRDVSREGAKTPFDDLIGLGPYGFGVSCLYYAIGGWLTKITPAKAFEHWEKF